MLIFYLTSSIGEKICLLVLFTKLIEINKFSRSLQKALNDFHKHCDTINMDAFPV